MADGCAADTVRAMMVATAAPPMNTGIASSLVTTAGIVGHQRRAGDDVGAGDLRDERAEQRDERADIDIAGDKAQRDRQWL